MMCITTPITTTEDDSADDPGDAQFQAEDAGCKNDGQHIYSGPRIEKRRRRAANRQNRPGNTGDPVSDDLVGLGPEIFHHRGLADEDRDRPGNEKGRHQTKHNMFARIPPDQMERLANGVVEAAGSDRQIEAGKEDDDNRGELLPFLFHNLLSDEVMAMYWSYRILSSFSLSLACCFKTRLTQEKNSRIQGVRSS